MQMRVKGKIGGDGVMQGAVVGSRLFSFPQGFNFGEIFYVQTRG